MTTGNFFMTFWHSGLNYQSHGSDHKQNLSLAEVRLLYYSLQSGECFDNEVKGKAEVPNLRGAFAAHDAGAGLGQE